MVSLPAQVARDIADEIQRLALPSVSAGVPIEAFEDALCNWQKSR